MVDVSIVLPVHNEATSIEKTMTSHYDQIASKISSSLIVAEDGSTDGTKAILLTLQHKIPIELLAEDKRGGYHRAVVRLLKHAEGDWIFFSDSDGQYLTSDFWTLWASKNGYDMVIGRKVHRMDAAHRIVLARGFHAIVNFLFGLQLHDADCGFRLIRREVAQSMVDKVGTLDYSFWAEFTIRTLLMGFKTKEVPINHRVRLAGTTQIYKPAKVPGIVLKQVVGLAKLYWELRVAPHRLENKSTKNN